MMRVTKGNVFFNIQKTYYNKADVFKLMGEFAEEITEVFIWEKTNPLPANGANITNAWEFILVFGEPLSSNGTYTKNHITTSVNPDTSEIHKAIMHQHVADFFIENFTKKGDIIYDPFMGSGTTAVSAIKNSCSYIGSETSEVYCDLAKEKTSYVLPKSSVLAICDWDNK